MADSLRLGPKLNLPLDAVTQTIAFLARKGAGKTYAAGKLVEQLLDAGAQTVVLDPVGVWYGLRLNSKGNPGGFDVPVLGGEHGDIPLEPGAGAMVADVIIERGTSAILDVSSFRKAQRKTFVEAFAEQLFQRKKSKRTPLHLVLEESQLFAPQNPRSGEERMLGAIEDIVRLGRNYGIGATLISQRPQSVNKEVLNQVECLFVLQTSGKHERKAIREWVVHQGLDVAGMVDELPSLPIGTAYLWSPQWLGRLEKVRIGKKKTFDASATPELGAQLLEPKRLGKVELREIEQAMSAVVERAAEEDPKALRRRIADLERQLAAAPTAQPAPKPERVEVEVPIMTDEDRAGIAGVDAKLDIIINAFTQVRQVLDGITEKSLRIKLAALQEASTSTISRPDGLHRGGRRVATHVRTLPQTPAPKRAPSTTAATAKLSPGERAILTAVAQHPDGVTGEQLSVLTTYKRSSRDTYLQKLRSAGLVDRNGGSHVVTEEGHAVLGPDFEPLPTGAALRQHWLETLGGGERVLLEEIIGAHPGSISRTVLDERTGYKRSSRDTYLQKLKARKLIVAVDRGEVRASDTLFEGGRR